MTLELLHGEEETVNGDSGYVGAEKREDAIVRNNKGKKSRYQINRRPSQIKKLSKSGQNKAKKREHAKSSVRCKVEHVFGCSGPAEIATAGPVENANFGSTEKATTRNLSNPLY